MSRVCHDPILAEHLGLLAAEFMEAAADQCGVSVGEYVQRHAQNSRKRARG
jgi:hypothetical protein